MGKVKLPKSEYHLFAHWARLGTYFGFPDRCIGAFIASSVTGEDVPKRKLHGTGYVPCEKCNKKSKTKLIAAIQENRICGTSFPDCSGFDEDFVNYVLP